MKPLGTRETVIMWVVLAIILFLVFGIVSVSYGQCPGGVCPTYSAPTYIQPSYQPTYQPSYQPYYSAPVVSYPVYQQPVVIHQQPVVEQPQPEKVEVEVVKAKPKSPRLPQIPVEAKEAGDMDFGVDRSKIAGKPCYKINGVEVTRSQAIRAASEPIPDDQNRFRLVLVGSDLDTRRVLSDTTRVISDRVIVQSYPIDSPLVKQRGWYSQGSPAISLLSPSGKVIARNLDGKYAGKDALIEAANRLTGSYDPSREGSKTGVYDSSKDIDLWLKPVDPKKPGPDGKSPFSPEQIPWWIWLAGGLAIALVLRKDK